jgi:hypothetical protein
VRHVRVANTQAILFLSGISNYSFKEEKGRKSAVIFSTVGPQLLV